MTAVIEDSVETKDTARSIINDTLGRLNERVESRREFFNYRPRYSREFPILSELVKEHGSPEQVHSVFKKALKPYISHFESKYIVTPKHIPDYIVASYMFKPTKHRDEDDVVKILVNALVVDKGMRIEKALNWPKILSERL